MAFELIPIPQSTEPMAEMSIYQEGRGKPEARVTLPDNWRSHADRSLADAIYRAQFDYPDAPERWAVFIPGFSGQLVVSINGVELPTGGLISGDLIADQSVPYFAHIPASALQATDNEIAITLIPGGKLVGFLGPVYIDRVDLIKPSFNWHYFRAVQLPGIVIFWQLLLAATLFVIWYSRRNERAALYCALTLVFSCLHGIPVFLPNSVVLANTVALLGLAINFWLSAIGSLFVAELTNHPLRQWARYVLAVPVVATIAFLILPEPAFHIVDLVFVVPFSLLLTGWIVYQLVVSAFRHRHQESAILLGSVISACALAVHETLILSNTLTDSNFLHFRVVYVLLLPGLSFIFVRRLVHSMHEVDTLVNTLEERVEASEQQLREAFDQRQRLERRQALNEERQRIMRDMHDGLGGQLTSIIAMASTNDAKPEAIEGSARAALEDLRTLIHSLGVEDDITGVLGTFRERAEQQLALHGIELDWRMVEIPTIAGLSPSAALAVLRILQEATTNVIKYSNSDRVLIVFSLIPGPPRSLQIDVEDNGVGFNARTHGGHGMRNMTSRADELRGRLDVRSSDQGTFVTLRVPIDLASIDQTDN